MRRSLVLGVAALLLVAGCGSDSAQEVSTDDGSATATYSVPAGTDAATVASVGRLLERRLDRLGVEDATVTVDGSDIEVAAPSGTPERVFDALDRRASLEFRPVLATQAPGATGTDVAHDFDGTTDYVLAPAAVTGAAIESSRAAVSAAGEWMVELVLKSAAIGTFNEVAATCFSTTPGCPTGQLALVVDGEVYSAPSIQAAEFERDQIQISGSFTEREAKDLAALLDAGVLPVPLERRRA